MGKQFRPGKKKGRRVGGGGPRLHVITRNVREVRIRQEETRVQLIEKDGAGWKVILDVPWDIALQIAAGIHTQAKKAEELAKASDIIFDQAILTRTGAPFGLSDHPRIKEEAAKEAVSNRTLRRALPGGVRSKEVIGAPTVIVKPPKESPK